MTSSASSSTARLKAKPLWRSRREIVGPDLARVADEPMMGSEDFADMLHAVPGAYFWLGMTPGAMVHNSAYTFDDSILPVGASLLARLAERRTAALSNAAG